MSPTRARAWPALRRENKLDFNLKDFDLDDMAGKLMGGVDIKKVASVIDAIWDHKDELARIAQNLPQLLGETGGHMQAAGEGAQRASAFLSGEVRDLASSAADLLEISKNQLRGVLKALEGVGNLLNNVPLIGDVGKSVGDGLKSLGEVANSMDSVSQKVRGLGDRLSDVGDDLDSMGRSLAQGGASLLGFVGGKAPKVRMPSFASGSGSAKKKSASKAKKKSSAKPAKNKATKKATKKKGTTKPAKKKARK